MIDPARFGREGLRLTGSVAPAQLSRVAQVLFDGGGTVGYRMQGMLSPRGEPALRVELDIDLAVACQRCTERLPIQLNVARTLIFRRELDELAAVADEEDDVDAIPLVPTLDELDLIDQEVMLSLPIAPRHADGECQARTGDGGDAVASSAFSVLSRLKQS